MFILCFFFFKQKTAYEMRISDWSSDVCSSDLPAGVRVNAILPGPVLTPQMKIAAKNDPKLGGTYENCAPLAGWTHPEDIAQPALFLASPSAQRINGHLLVVDGGLSVINQDCLVLA